MNLDIETRGMFPLAETISTLKSSTILLLILASCTLTACSHDSYEVLERSEKDVPNYNSPGTHTEVHYVMLHDKRKIHATCASEIDRLDPNARCSFRPLRTYKCVLGEDIGENKGAAVLSDLRCKDSDGNNVYLYVDKAE